MIIFDRLQISNDGQKFYIDVHVNKADYFDNISISRVIIKTSDQVSETDPLSSLGNSVFDYTTENSPRELNLALDASIDLDTPMSTLSDKLFFVYVICQGTPGECTPCRLDEMTTLGVTFDTTVFYQKVMQYTRELTDSCVVPKEFINMILLWNGFNAAVETEHYIAAIDFWKKMFVDSYTSITSNNICHCHG